MLAVLRVEADRRDPPVLTGGQEAAFTDAALRVARVPDLRGIQVDFDAGLSQRAFYERVLNRIRSGLPPEKVLSVTALASWCAGDPWLARLPADETVVMLFRMGPDGGAIRRAGLQALRSGGPAMAYGVSLDEPQPLPSKQVRTYWFSPKPWNEARFRETAGEVPFGPKT